jgi:disulfide bond formation protein DsbB
MNSWHYLLSAWILSLIASLGSLFFSEVMGYPPCVLCWYQRIAMYPLVVILPWALFPFNRLIPKALLPLTLIGWGIAFYHNLLYYKILPESHSPCVKGISCTSVQLQWLGFITIPLLSWVAFSLIILCSLLALKKGSTHEQ